MKIGSIVRLAETELVIEVRWESRGETCDVDLGCVLLDAQGRVLEIIDFNNPVSNDRGVSHGGDAVDSKEQLFVDTRKLKWTAAVTAMIFNKTFAKLASLEMTVKHDWKIMSKTGLRDLEPTANFAVLCAIAGGEIECVMSQALARTRGELMHATQQGLGRLYPWLKDEKRCIFESVPEVCAALSSQALPTLKPKFLAEKKGLRAETFVETLFRQLATRDARLKASKEASTLVALLHELFGQIDINGDERVDWDEFTSHTISSGMQAQARLGSTCSVAATPDEFDVKFVEDRAQSLAKPIALMRYVDDLERILVVEKGSPIFQAYDKNGNFQHDYNFQEAEDASRKRREQSYATREKGGDALLFYKSETVEEEKEAKKEPHCTMIYDIIYIAERSTLAVALSDHAIHLLVEQLSSSGKHRTYKSAGVIVTHALHRKLVWSGAADRLFTVDTYSRLYAWCLDTATKRQKYASQPFAPHNDILMDCILLKDKGLLATCGLDRKIHLWGIETLRNRGTLHGHKLGVRCLAYAQCALVSGGFDNTVCIWDLISRDCMAKLQGHKTAICAVDVAAPSIETAMIVALDDVAECRIWRLTFATAATELLEIVQLDNADDPEKSLALPKARTVDDLSDVCFGLGSNLLHMTPCKTLREFAPPSALVFNTLSLHFVAAVATNVHVWDSRTGTYLHKFDISKKGTISCICFDSPRQRRLFAGTEHGDILTINYVTGAVLAARNNAHGHAEVFSVAFCQRTKRCLVSLGNDRRLIVWHDVKSDLMPLRTVVNAHAAPVACFAYAPFTSIIVTGDCDGALAIWDFQTVKKQARVLLDASPTAATVVEDCKLVVVGDAAGTVRVWRLDVDDQLVPVCSLSAASTITALVGLCPTTKRRRSTRSSFCLSADADFSPQQTPEKTPSLYAGTESGHLLAWTLSVSVPKDDAPVSSYKPFRKVVRNMAQGDPSTKVVDASSFASLPLHEPAISRLAHDESTLRVIVVDDPPCVATTSADGFSRLWTPQDLNPYGEFRLPNVVDSKRTVPHHDWTYYHSTPLLVGPEHDVTAKRILNAMSSKNRFRMAVRKLIELRVFFGSKLQVDPSDQAKVQEEWNRRRRSSSKKVRRHSGRHKVAPRTTCLAQLTASSQEEEEESPSKPTSKLKRKYLDDLPLAFSTTSIAQGLDLGFYDVEAVERLRGIAKYSERRSAYDRRLLGTAALPELNLKDEEAEAKVDDEKPIVKVKTVGDVTVPMVYSAPPVQRKSQVVKNKLQRHVDKMARAIESPSPTARKTTQRKSIVGTLIKSQRRSSSYTDLSFDEIARPHYSGHDIVDFRDSFNYCDVDLSGSINIDEWFMFMRRMNQKLAPVDSQRLFLHIDKDCDGSINMRELIAIVFQRCAPDQQRNIFLKLQDLNLAEAEQRRLRSIDLTYQIQQHEMFRTRS